MKRLLTSSLAICLATASGLASAQTYRSDPYQAQQATRYDYARVLRVDPVFDNRHDTRYDRGYTSGQRCYERQTYVRGDGYDDGYGSGGQYGNGGYYGDGYARDGYYETRQGGTRTGSTVATIVGGIVGAAIGSQVGGGSARYATSAIGSMVGGMAGREIYDRRHRVPDRVGTVTVCDPAPVNAGYGTYDSRTYDGGTYDSRTYDGRTYDGRTYDTGYGDRAVTAYDVTYEYAGQQYTTRTSYHPGDRIRVRVDVRPE